MKLHQYLCLKNLHWVPPLVLSILTSSMLQAMVPWLLMQKFSQLLGLLPAFSLNIELWALSESWHPASGSAPDKMLRIQAAPQAGFPAPPRVLQSYLSSCTLRQLHTPSCHALEQESWCHPMKRPSLIDCNITCFEDQLLHCRRNSQQSLGQNTNPLLGSCVWPPAYEVCLWRVI